MSLIEGSSQVLRLNNFIVQEEGGENRLKNCLQHTSCDWISLVFWLLPRYLPWFEKLKLQLGIMQLQKEMEMEMEVGWWKWAEEMNKQKGWERRRGVEKKNRGRGIERNRIREWERERKWMSEGEGVSARCEELDFVCKGR